MISFCGWCRVGDDITDWFSSVGISFCMWLDVLLIGDVIRGRRRWQMEGVLLVEDGTNIRLDVGRGGGGGGASIVL